MTADEMLKKQGYTLSREADGTFVYSGEAGDVIIITGNFVHFTDADEDYKFTAFSADILAVARKLEELEAENG